MYLKNRNGRVERLKILLLLGLFIVAGCSTRQPQFCQTDYERCVEGCEQSRSYHLNQCKEGCYQQFLECKNQMELPIYPKRGF